MLDIKVTPEEIWEFLNANQKRLLDEMFLVAEDDTNCIEVYVTFENTVSYFKVYIFDEVILEEPVVSSKDAMQTYYKIISRFDYDKKGSEDKNKIDDEGLDFDEALERIDEIEMAAYDYLTTLLQAPPEDFGMDLQEIDDFSIEVEKLLLNTFGILVDHPRLDENSEKVISKYSIEFNEDEFEYV